MRGSGALERKLAGDAPATVDAELQAELEALDADGAFLHRANVGQERFADEDIARVHELAQRAMGRSQRTDADAAYRRRA